MVCCHGSLKIICCLFFRTELSYQGYNNTICARWGNLTSSLPPHPPPYVMFSSLLTWCSHKQSEIPSYLIFAAALPEDVFQMQWIVVVCTGAVMLQRCITNSWNQINNLNESLSRPKCRINSFPHTPAISSLVTAFIQCNYKYVIMWSSSSRPIRSWLLHSVIKKVLVWDKIEYPMLETCQSWRCSCKLPNIGSKFESPCQSIVCWHVACFWK